MSFISSFEKALATETRRRKCDGIVCGHIHKPEMKFVGDILYTNDGDWVESLSALVEHFDGRLEILYWGGQIDELTASTTLKSNKNFDQAIA